MTAILSASASHSTTVSLWLEEGCFLCHRGTCSSLYTVCARAVPWAPVGTEKGASTHCSSSKSCLGSKKHVTFPCSFTSDLAVSRVQTCLCAIPWVVWYKLGQQWILKGFSMAELLQVCCCALVLL